MGENRHKRGQLFTPHRVTHHSPSSLFSFLYPSRHTVVENNGDFYLFAGADSESRTNDLFIFSNGMHKYLYNFV